MVHAVIRFSTPRPSEVFMQTPIGDRYGTFLRFVWQYG
jgi:hypothetical protein